MPISPVPIARSPFGQSRPGHRSGAFKGQGLQIVKYAALPRN
jgi:hypothetical protein